jgi:hypothetical protein
MDKNEKIHELYLQVLIYIDINEIAVESGKHNC